MGFLFHLSHNHVCFLCSTLRSSGAGAIVHPLVPSHVLLCPWAHPSSVTHHEWHLLTSPPFLCSAAVSILSCMSVS